MLQQFIVLSLTLIFGYQSSKFHEDVNFSLDNQCKKNPNLKKELDSLYPKLENCYSFSSLYFSTANDVCSDSCRNLTIDASKFIVKYCNLSSPNSQSPLAENHHHSYNLWSNKEAVEVVCAKKGGRSSSCITELLRAKTIIDNSKAKSPVGFWQISKTDKDKVCNECIKDIYNTFKNQPFNIPMVYYSTILKPEEFLKDINVLCF
ncbi:hypothetical protein K502DRAFT_351524 [Neoconidiobolus thromboides FSU 785]|nr:hypothetical protein K502DRAFT_351524 [Neoconidiobolus thromboides FSU 785]